jgi:ectoine hydroxylase-related dioxygenase (phytanoyl-CoA dioxygenase family)
VATKTEFDQRGFLSAEIFGEQEIGNLSYALDKCQAARSRAGIRHLLSDSSILAFANDRRLIELSSELVGAGTVPFRATLFDKSPKANWKVTWHQDTALPLTEKKDISGWGPWSVKEGVIYAHATTNALNQIIALRIHLDHSTARNGPLRVIPASHRSGVLIDDAVAVIASQQKFVECLAPKGTVLAMKPLLIHSSSKSMDDSPRRVLHIEYTSSMSVGDGMTLAIA